MLAPLAGCHRCIQISLRFHYLGLVSILLIHIANVKLYVAPNNCFSSCKNCRVIMTWSHSILTAMSFELAAGSGFSL